MESPQPSLDPSRSSSGPFRRFLHTILGMAAFCAFALIVWPGLVALTMPGVDLRNAAATAQIRFGAFAALGLTMVARMLVSPGKRRTKHSLAWEAFASEIGGTFTEEKRSIDKLGWRGGPAVRWVMQGAPIRLSNCADNGGAAKTNLLAEIHLAQGFQFQLFAQNFITKALMSPRLWNLILAGVKQQAGQGVGAEEGVRLVQRMSFLAGKDLTIGDAEFDAAFLLKTDDESRARDLFSDAGVRHWLRELNAVSKGWGFSMMAADGSDGHRLSLQGPGVVLDPNALKAAHALMGATIERLERRNAPQHGGKRAA